MQLVRLDFRAVRKDLDDWQARWAGDAQEAGFPYLHQSLKFPGIRVMKALPDVTA